MNTEDRLWDYIDGTCSEEDRIAIEQLLKTDATGKRKYDDLFSLNQHLQSMELDEPSMGFKNRVMEQVLASPHPSVLKTRVDQRIIYGIAAFFIITIGGVLGYTFSKMNWGSPSGYNLPTVKMPEVNWSLFTNPTYTLFFLSVNMVLGLYLVDKYIHARRKHSV